MARQNELIKSQMRLQAASAERSGIGGRDKSWDDCGYPSHWDGAKCP